MTRAQVLAVRSSLYRGYVHARERANELEKLFGLARQVGMSDMALDVLAQQLLAARSLEQAWSKAVIRLGNEATGKWP